MKLLALFITASALVAQTVQTTPNIGLYEPAHGTLNWDVFYNSNWGTLDTNLGSVNSSLTGFLQAKLTPSVDNTVVIQAALTAAGSSSYSKVVRLPAGSYTITNLTIPAGVTLEGSGQGQTILNSATSGAAITINGHHVTLRQFTLNGPGHSGTGISMSDKYWFSTEFLAVTNWHYGIYASKSIYHSHKQLFADFNDYGVYYWGAAGTWNVDFFNNVITFDTCRFSNAANVGAYVLGDEVLFINPDFSGNISLGAIGLQVVGYSGQISHGIHVISPYVENTQTAFSVSYGNLIIEGGFLDGGASTNAPNGNNSNAMTSQFTVANNSTVYLTGVMTVFDDWQYGYQVSNSSKIIAFNNIGGGIRGSNTVDSTSMAAVQSYSEGTFTATLTGFTSNPSVTVSYVQTGKRVTLYIPQTSGTSNATTMTLTGIPAALTPATTNGDTGVSNGVDGGSEVLMPWNVTTSSTINFYKSLFSGAWTASGTKSVRASAITYTLF